MNIAAKGSPKQLEELNSVLSSAGYNFTVLENTTNISTLKFDVIFDLDFDENPENISDYTLINPDTVLIVGAIRIQLHEAIPKKLRQQVIGINSMPTFLCRPVLEASTLNIGMNLDFLIKMGWKKVNIVGSRIGMVTPRIICMIINEAFFTLQEGTASRDDIDKGMKLGTAYPYGPFEWCEKIGIKNVYELLQKLSSDTNDERYKICNLLKTEYLISKD